MSYRKRTGSKSSQKEQINKAMRFIGWLGEHFPEVKRVEQVGRKHVQEYLNYLVANRTSKQDLYKYSLAIKALWADMDRPGNPPSFNHKGERC